MGVLGVIHMDKTQCDKDALLQLKQRQIEDLRQTIAQLVHSDVQNIADWQYYKALYEQQWRVNKELREENGRLVNKLMQVKNIAQSVFGEYFAPSEERAWKDL